MSDEPRTRRRTRRHRARHLSAVVAVTAAVLLAAGCSGGSGTTTVVTDPAAAVKAAALKTSSANTVHIEMTEELSGVAHLTVTVSGDVDRVAKRESITTDLRSTKLQLIRDGDTFFARAGGTGKWTQINLDPSLVDKVASQFNPQEGQLELLQQLGVKLQNVGDVTTGGTRTAHYVGTLDWQKLLGAITSAGVLSSQDANLVQSNASGSSGTLDVYVDGEQRVQEETTHLSLEIKGQSIRVVTTARFTNYGSPVNITVPTPDQVASTHDVATFADFGQVIAQLELHGGGVPS